MVIHFEYCSDLLLKKIVIKKNCKSEVECLEFVKIIKTIYLKIEISEQFLKLDTFSLAIKKNNWEVET